MNWKRGFKRLATVLSFLGAGLGIIAAGAITSELTSVWSIILALVFLLPIGAIIGWLLVWRIYELLQWIVLGFCQDNREDGQKTNKPEQPGGNR